MGKLAEFRAKYPEYSDLSDQQLADALHAKHYSDIPKDEFYQRIGLASRQPAADASDAPKNRPIEVTAPDGTIIEFPAGTPDDKIKSVMERNFPSTQSASQAGMADNQREYIVTAPDGRTYTIQGPVGATKGEIIAEVLRQHPEAGVPSSMNNEPGPWAKYDSPSQVDLGKVQRNVKRIIDGGGSREEIQLYLDDVGVTADMLREYGQQKKFDALSSPQHEVPETSPVKDAMLSVSIALIVVLVAGGIVWRYRKAVLPMLWPQNQHEKTTALIRLGRVLHWISAVPAALLVTMSFYMIGSEPTWYGPALGAIIPLMLGRGLRYILANE